MFKYENFDMVRLLVTSQERYMPTEDYNGQYYLFPPSHLIRWRTTLKVMKFEDKAPAWYKSLRDYVFKTFTMVDLTEEEAHPDVLPFRIRANSAMTGHRNQRGRPTTIYVGKETNFPTVVNISRHDDFFDFRHVDWLGEKEAFMVYSVETQKTPLALGIDGPFAYKEHGDGSILVHDFHNSREYGLILRLP